LWVVNDDGSASLIPEDEWRPAKRKRRSRHFDNLVELLDTFEVSRLGQIVHDGVRADIESRREYMEMTAESIRMLGLKIEKARTDTSNGAPIEGMSVVRHPLLLEAVLGFQADFVGEMLPAAGPVKVRDDATAGAVPDTVVKFVLDQLVAAGALAAEAVPGLMASIAQTQAPAPMTLQGQLAADLETDFNYFLTTTATEYYPDTDRAAFVTGLMGCTFKKVYNCPLRERPVSESVGAPELIVDAGVTDLANAPRVTHEITMLPHEVLELQEAGVYTDAALGQPLHVPNAVEEAAAEAQGWDANTRRPEDRPHTMWECYCRLNVRGLDDGDEEAGIRVPRPYKVTIDRDSREVYEIRRNWSEGDDRFRARRVFVQYNFVPALGFYGIGLMHLLGNSTMALTAAWRLNLDAMMFAVFPGFIYADVMGKQVTNVFRIPPGGAVPMQTGGRPIRDMLMQPPYGGPQAAGLQLIDTVTQTAGRVGARPNVPTGEGVQNVPVGTMMANIVEATKLTGAVFKRLHAAQAQEFGLLRERFIEDPEAFWRHNKKPARDWQKAELIAALNDADLVPAADPNTPSRLHRIMVALAGFNFAQAAPQVFKIHDTAVWLAQSIGMPVELIDTEENIAAKQAAMAQQGQGGGKAPDPGKQQVDMMKAQAAMAAAAAKTKQVDAQVGLMGAQTQKTGAEAASVGQDQTLRAHEAATESADRAADRRSQMAIDMTREETARLRLAQEAGQGHADRVHEATQAAIGREHEAGLAALDRAPSPDTGEG
jgi:hypothetical protein